MRSTWQRGVKALVEIGAQEVGGQDGHPADPALLRHAWTRPPGLGGVDAAPTAAESLVAALAGCLTSGIAANAALFDVPDRRHQHRDGGGHRLPRAARPRQVRAQRLHRHPLHRDHPEPGRRGAGPAVQGDHRPQVAGGGYPRERRRRSRRGSSSSRADRAGVPGEVNCIFTKGLIPFVEKEVGPEGVAAICRVAGRSRDYLMADHNWIPFAVADEMVQGLPGADERARRGALGAALRRVLHGLEAARGALLPRHLLHGDRQPARRPTSGSATIYGQQNRGSTGSTSLEVGRRRARYRWTPLPGHRMPALDLHLAQGAVRALPDQLGSAPGPRSSRARARPGATTRAAGTSAGRIRRSARRFWLPEPGGGGRLGRPRRPVRRRRRRLAAPGRVAPAPARGAWRSATRSARASSAATPSACSISSPRRSSTRTASWRRSSPSSRRGSSSSRSSPI